MAHQPITNIDDPRYVKAISHPLRVRILAMLQERTASPSQLSEWLGATLGTTAYHVRALHKLGLIELADETRVRGAIEHHYRAGIRPLVSEKRVIIPWLNRFANGSSKLTSPKSCSTRHMKRAYSRCRMACSIPPL